MSLRARLRLVRDMLLALSSPLYDEEWYRRQNPEVQNSRSDPCLHFVSEGWLAGRDPGPHFSCSWYLQQNPNVWATGVNPLLHYLRGGHTDGIEPLPGKAPTSTGALLLPIWDRTLVAVRGVPRLLRALVGPAVASAAEPRLASVGATVRFVPGKLENDPSWPTVLVCGHASGRYLFGGERSLLDLLDAFRELQVNVIATLPVPNVSYEAQVAARCTGIYIFAYPQWTAQLAEVPSVVDRFGEIIATNSVSVVHVNTIMLREPLTAARKLDRIAVVHARELIGSDSDLTAQIGMTPESIVETVSRRADFLMANSAATAECYGRSSKVLIVTNSVDVETFKMPNVLEGSSVRVGLLSSNTPKKGIADFMTVASLCERDVPEARFVAVGPETSFTTRLREEKCPGNVEFVGYVESPREAIGMANIVVNLSHVAESFGRSVAEAMAAGRPVVVYDQGALRDLVIDGESGYRVAVGDCSAVARRIAELCKDPEEIMRMGKAARQSIGDRFSHQATVAQLASAYGAIFERVERR